MCVQAVENLLGVQLSDDIGEWVTDGVILCQIINKLHPDTVAHINEPPSGQVSRKRVLFLLRMFYLVVVLF